MMTKFEGNLQPDYIKQFKENFIEGLLGEDNIDDETLEVITSSAEKLDSYSVPSTSHGLKSRNNDSKSKVRKNLFGTLKYTNELIEKKALSSSLNKCVGSWNIQQSPDSKEDIFVNKGLESDNIILSQTIKHRPGKFFGSGGSPKSLNGYRTPKRKKSSTKLSKFSPFSKKARLGGSSSIKSYFSVVKTTNVNYLTTNQVNIAGISKLNNNLENSISMKEKQSLLEKSIGESSNGLSEKCESQISPFNSIMKNDTVPSTPQKSEYSSSPSTSSKPFTPTKSPKKLYVDTYNNLVIRIISEMYLYNISVGQVSKLLSSEEDDYMKVFTSLSITAQRIYCRLLSRKFDWIRVSTIKYPQITEDLDGVIKALENCGLVTLDLTNENFVDLCNFLKLPELKSICQRLNISQLKNGKKSDIIDQLVTHYKQKPITSFFQGNETNNVVRDKVLSALGQYVKLKEEPRKTMFRCLLFFSYPHYRGLERDRFQNQLSLLRAWTDNEANFPEYNVLRTNLFPSREHFLEYEAALAFKSKIIETMEMKDWDTAVDLILSVINKYKQFVQNTERLCWVKELPDFLRRFTAGAVYVSSINKGIDVLKKYNEYLPEAKECLRMFLNQNVFAVHRRGQWFEQLALLYQRNYKNNVKAASVVSEGLMDKKNLDTVSRHILSARASLLIGRKTNQISGICKDTLRSLIEPVLNEPFTVEISEQLLPNSIPGYKQIYVQDSEEGKTLTSVEDVARLHFKKKGYTQGRHDEGGTIKTLVLACFWDIIYSTTIVEGGHSLFHSAFQNEPLDWNTEGFFLRRKEAIEEKLQLLLDGGINLLWTIIEECYNKNGMNEGIVHWNFLHESLHIVKGLVECLGIKSFVAIARLLITNYATYHSGFPDLTLWDPCKKKCLFVEVKSPNDTLKIKQKLWLHNLEQFSVPALVCHVKSVGCKSKKKTVSPT